MKRIFLILSLLILNVSMCLYSQFYIGLHKDQIMKLMKEKYNDFNINTDFVNKTYKYLKFENKIDEQTILFFLDEKDYCSFIRWMSDYSNINSVTADLNRSYPKLNKHLWSFNRSGVNYLINLKEEEWYFTITVKQK